MDNLINDDPIDLAKEFCKYFSFWPYILIFLSISFFVGLLNIRYTTELYNTSAKIEILDKSQDSEMALPTAMTVFNRSMINLENDMKTPGNSGKKSLMKDIHQAKSNVNQSININIIDNHARNSLEII